MDAVAQRSLGAGRSQAEIDKFIERQSRKGEQDPGEREDLWKESVRRHNEARRRENTEAWRLYHLEQAERAERNGLEIAAEHRQRAEALAGLRLGASA